MKKKDWSQAIIAEPIWDAGSVSCWNCGLNKIQPGEELSRCTFHDFVFPRNKNIYEERAVNCGRYMSMVEKEHVGGDPRYKNKEVVNA